MYSAVHFIKRENAFKIRIVPFRDRNSCGYRRNINAFYQWVEKKSLISIKHLVIKYLYIELFLSFFFFRKKDNWIKSEI